LLIDTGQGAETEAGVRVRVRSTQTESATAAGLAAGADALEETGPGSNVLRRARQLIARIVCLHGGRIQKGKTDGG
jgi:hypothetical protein